MHYINTLLMQFVSKNFVDILRKYFVDAVFFVECRNFLRMHDKKLGKKLRRKNGKGVVSFQIFIKDSFTCVGSILVGICLYLLLH